MKNPEYKKNGIKNAGAIKFAKFSSGDIAEMKYAQPVQAAIASVHARYVFTILNTPGANPTRK